MSTLIVPMRMSTGSFLQENKRRVRIVERWINFLLARLMILGFKLFIFYWQVKPTSTISLVITEFCVYIFLVCSFCNSDIPIVVVIIIIPNWPNKWIIGQDWSTTKENWKADMVVCNFSDIKPIYLFYEEILSTANFFTLFYKSFLPNCSCWMAGVADRKSSSW